MRVGVLSHPTLNMFSGGLPIRVNATIDALRTQGVECRFINPFTERLADFDVVHIFSALHSTHLIVRAANSAGVPVVLSCVLPFFWSRWKGTIADLCDRLVGRLTNWEVQTTFGQIRRGLQTADRVIVLGQAEHRVVTEVFGVPPTSVSIIPNAVSDAFFDADGNLFKTKYRIERPFVLSVGYIGEYKNQLGLIRALRGEDIDIVLIGGCDGVNRAYLDRCITEGGQRVHYLGFLDHGDPLLPSAFAAATAFALPSVDEVAPTAVLEALAAGKPVLMTKYHSLDLHPRGNELIEVDPFDLNAIRAGIQKILKSPPPAERCVELVKELRWNRIAQNTIAIYQECLAAKQR